MSNTQNETVSRSGGLKGMNTMLTIFGGMIILASLFVYMPIAIFSILAMVETDQTVTYAIFTTVLVLATILEVFLARFLYRSLRRKIISMLHKRAFELFDDFMTYRQTHVTSRPITFGTIPYEKITGCIVSNYDTSIKSSRSGSGKSVLKEMESIINQQGNVIHEEGQPIQIAIHIVYNSENGLDVFSCNVEDSRRADELLGTMHMRGIGLRWTAHDVSSIPAKTFAHVITEELPAANLPYNGHIKDFLYTVQRDS